MKSQKPIHSQPILLQTVETSIFDSYLDGLRFILNGCNYVTYFEERFLALPDSRFPMREIMLASCPRSQPNEANIKKCSLKILIEVTEECLSYPDASYMETEYRETITETIRSDFWRHLKNCIDYENAAIYSYNSRIGMPFNDAFWGFSWLIHNRKQKRCMFLFGSASD